MGDHSTSEEPQGHPAFAAAAFNRAWELIDLGQRTPDETAEMIDAAHASAWHWRYRADRTPKTDSVAAWQLSRVYALAGDADAATRHGRRSLLIARENSLDSFYVGYAHEALARAAQIAGDEARKAEHLGAAAQAAALIADEGDRSLLEADLRSLG